MSEVAIFDRVLELERIMLAMPQVQLQHIDHFSERVYARELHIPKGVTLTGKIHKYTNMNFLLKGEITVSHMDDMVRMVAPCIVVSPAGTKRVAYAHEDCIWVTVHGTGSKDVQEIESEFIAQTEMEYLEFRGVLALGEN